MDSGCSNHMSGARSLFQDLNELQKMQVRLELEDDKKIQVERRGTIVVKINHGKVKHLHNIFYVPSLAHNLLSVG